MLLGVGFAQAAARLTPEMTTRQLDKQGAPPPAVTDQAELQALIEEARRRARRRRLGFLVLLVALGAIGGLALLIIGGSDQGPTDGASNAGSGSNREGQTLYLRATTSKTGELTSVNAQTGETRTLPIDVSCGDTPFCLISTGRDLVISSVGRTTVYDPRQQGRPRDQRMGAGWITVPSADPGRVWLGIRAQGKVGGVHIRGLGEVREVDTQGREIRSMRPPGGDWPVFATKGGLLFWAGADHLRFWSLSEGGFTTRIAGGWPLATDGDLVLTCDAPCARLALTNVRTREVTRYAPPPGYHGTSYAGSFSADGSLFAVSLARDDQTEKDRPRALEIVDVTTGKARLVPDAHPDPIYNALTWSTSGDRLFFVDNGRTIRSYKPGAPRQETVAHVPGRRDGSVLEMVAVSSPPSEN